MNASQRAGLALMLWGIFLLLVYSGAAFVWGNPRLFWIAAGTGLLFEVVGTVAFVSKGEQE